jgi:hypothetical protein
MSRYSSKIYPNNINGVFFFYLEQSGYFQTQTPQLVNVPTFPSIGPVGTNRATVKIDKKEVVQKEVIIMASFV